MDVIELTQDDLAVLETVGDGIVPPGGTIAFVALKNNQAIGRLLLMAPVHIEGTWVHPEHRRALVGWRLMAAAVKKAREVGIRTLFAYAPNEETEGYLERLGFKKQSLSVWKREISCR